MESPSAATYKEALANLSHNQASCLKVIQWLQRKACFSEKDVKEVTTHERWSSTGIYQKKWSTFYHWCCERGTIPSRHYSADNWLLHVLAYRKGVLSASHQMLPMTFNHDFSLAGTNLIRNRMISMFLKSFETSCLPYETKPNTFDCVSSLQKYDSSTLSCPWKDLWCLRCTSFCTCQKGQWVVWPLLWGEALETLVFYFTFAPVFLSLIFAFRVYYPIPKGLCGWG